MDKELAIKRLKRVHDSAVRAEKDSAPVVVQEFNESLSMLKNQFPDNDFIQYTDNVVENVRTPAVATDEEYITEENALEKVKLKTEQLADSLDLGDDFVRPTDENEMSIIALEYAPSQENVQEAYQKADPEMTQNVNQEVSVESIMQLIDLDPQVRGNQEEVKELVRQFEEELESDDPDDGALRQFIADVKEYSTSVAAKLSMLGLQHGAIGILGL